MYSDADDVNADREDASQSDRDHRYPPHEREQGVGQVASMDFLHMSDRPHLQRRMQTCTGTAADNVAAPGTKPAIEVSSGSTGKRRKTSGTAGLVEATTSGTKALVASIDKIQDSTEAVEEKRSKDLAVVAEKQLEYFRSRDRKINRTQKGLVHAISSLSQMMGRSFAAQQGTSRGANPAPRDFDATNIPVPPRIPQPSSVGGDGTSASDSPTLREEEVLARAQHTLLSSDSSHSDGADSDGSSLK
jgi:hypothetical protein